MSQRNAAGTTLTGMLVQHRGHALTADTAYKIPEGHVYGTPYLILRCATCNETAWDEPDPGQPYRPTGKGPPVITVEWRRIRITPADSSERDFYEVWKPGFRNLNAFGKTMDDAIATLLNKWGAQ